MATKRPSSTIGNRHNNSYLQKSGNNLSQTSFYSNKPKTNEIPEFNDMDIARIREFIQILEEHQMKCEKEKKFVDAEIAKQKVSQLKQVEKEKILNDIRFNHEEELSAFESEKQQAFEEFNREWNSSHKELFDKFEEFDQRLKKNQQAEINDKIVEIDNKFLPIVKPTSEILNLTKILNGLIRQKEYIKAHQIQTQINKLSNIDNSLYLQEKENKLNRELEKLKQKHEQEYQVLLSKKDLAEAEYAKNRKQEYEKMIQGFKNRLKEIETHQSYELSQILNPRKYLARNLNRSSSLVNQSRVNSNSSFAKAKGTNIK